ncbi:MAG: hypothetical protein ACOH13_02890 [Flavobacteriales bacterium]
MNQGRLPLSTVTLVFGALSIPLAFARQLCVPALIMGVLAIGFHFYGRSKRRKTTYGPHSVKRSRLGFLMAVAGTICALAMWVLWATGALL